MEDLKLIVHLHPYDGPISLCLRHRPDDPRDEEIEEVIEQVGLTNVQHCVVCEAVKQAYEQSDRTREPYDFAAVWLETHEIIDKPEDFSPKEFETVDPRLLTTLRRGLIYCVRSESGLSHGITRAGRELIAKAADTFMLQSILSNLPWRP